MSKWRVFYLFFAFVVLLELSLNFLKPKTLQYYRDTKLIHTYHPDYYVGLEKNQSVFITHYNDLWKGQFDTNSMGYRGLYEFDPKKNQIACLGDSIVMGFGVSNEETFCHQLNGISFSNENLQSINLGVDAYGSLGSYKRLKEATQKLNIKVTLFFIAPNDFTLPQELLKQGILPDDTIDKSREQNPNFKQKFRWQFQLTKYSYLLQALKLSYEQLKVKLAISQNAFVQFFEQWDSFLQNSNKIDYLVSFVKYTFYRFPEMKCEKTQQVVCPQTPPKQFQCQKTEIKNLKPLPDFTKSIYQKMIDLSREKQFVLIPVLLPIQVEDLYCFSNGLNSNFYRYALRAKTFFSKQKVPVIDLREYTTKMCGKKLIQNGKEKVLKIEDYFIQGDGHLTATGNQWVAESLKLALAKYEKNAF